MKVYRGYNPRGHTSSAHLVTVAHQVVPDCDVKEELLAHRVHHSPTGFSWGYAGSGPADLARSLLWDFLGNEPAPWLYQAFKFQYVAKWPQDGNWVLTGEEIRQWLLAEEHENPGRSPLLEKFEEEEADD
jgi:hypothetical protein